MGFLDSFSNKISTFKALKPADVLEGQPAGHVSPTPAQSGESPDKHFTVGQRETFDSDGEKGVPTHYKPHIFQDPEVAAYYKDVYDSCNYEGRNYFDPNFYWSPKEERKALWKTEWCIVGWAFIMFFALDIDRFNLSNAIAGSFLKDNKLTTSDYNLGNTINLVFFMFAEIPSQLISKRLGPDVWIPMQMVMWSFVAIFQSFMSNRAGFLATRALLGLLEGGFIPDIILWMSYFYTAGELSVRLGYFYVANSATQAISGLLAFGIQHLDGKGGWAGWRYIFMIEGLISLAIGVASFFMMPPSVVQTKAWWRPNGWYTHREEKIMVNRVLRDDPSKGDMNNREGINVRHIIQSICEWQMWPIYGCRILLAIPGLAISRYMSLILRSMKFSTLHVDLLVIPSNVAAIITVLAIVYFCQWSKRHYLCLSITAVWLSVCLGVLRWWPGSLVKHWPSYALLVVLLAFPSTDPITSSWVSANSNSVRTRTIATAISNVFFQAGSITASNVLRSDDAPLYHRASMQLFCVALGGLGMVQVAHLFYKYLNASREKKWNAMSEEEQIEYMKANRDASVGRLDFRFSI